MRVGQASSGLVRAARPGASIAEGAPAFLVLMVSGETQVTGDGLVTGDSVPFGAPVRSTARVAARAAG